MATIIPSPNGAESTATPGERRFARRLESKLEDDYLCWYEPRVGTGMRSRYTDFIVLHPGRGLLMLEVKDWRIDTLRRADRHTFDLLLGGGVKRKPNPLEQVRQCTYRLVKALERDRALKHAEGRYAGALVFPYAYGVVLTAITRTQFDRAGLDEVLPAHLVICRDEMTSEVGDESFQTRLWNMFTVRFPVAMTLPQIDRVRAHLFPEIVIPEQGVLLEPFGEAATASPAIGDDGRAPADGTVVPPVDSMLSDVVRVLDREQETLARGLGDGHRVIHGVAGSGKTLILAYRCAYLARLATKPILVLCFNVTLAARLREMLDARGLGGRVHIHNFHEWCRRQLRTYHIEPAEDGPDFHERTVERLVAAVKTGRVPRAQYEAVMIDEGHDFEADYFACRFAQDWLADGETSPATANAAPRRWEMMPFGGGRHGTEPRIEVLPDGVAEAEHVARHVRARHEAGVPWSDIAVLYRAVWHGTLIEAALLAAGVPVYRVRTRADKRHLSLSEPSLKLMTIHDARGLEFPSVVVAGTGAMPGPRAEDVTREAKLLYIGLTRATNDLLVTADRRTAFVDRLAA